MKLQMTSPVLVNQKASPWSDEKDEKDNEVASDQIKLNCGSVHV